MLHARNPAILWRSTSRGPVVLAPAADTPERLGGAAAVVWEVLDRPMTAAALASAVTAVIGQELEVTRALDELRAAGWVIDA